MDAPEPVLVVPARGLVLLIGASGSGKTTFAHRHFGPTEVLSSDAFRELVGDDEADQTATPAAFDVLTRVLVHRLRRGRLSVVDATNILPADRRSLLQLAAVARRPTVAVVFDLPEAVCQERNAGRGGRVVDPVVVRRHVEGVRRALADPDRLLGEGFTAVHVMDDAARVDRVRVVRDPGLARPAAVAGAGGPGPHGSGRRSGRRCEAGERPAGRISPRPNATRGGTA